MSKLSDLIQEFCPNGVEHMTLGDIGRVAMCKRIMKSETNTEKGVPFYKIGTFGGVANAYISELLFEKYKKLYSYPKKGDILISAAGTIGRTVVFDGAPAYFQDSNIVWLEHDESKVLNKYLYYFYETKPWKISTGGTIARIYNDDICSVRLPVPPLEIQREIVRILDNFTELTTELTAELAARKQQYSFYRDKLLTLEREYRTGKIIDMLAQPITDGPHTTPTLVDDGIPFLSAEAVYDGRIHFEKMRGYITEAFDAECCKKYKPQKDDVFMVKSGSTTGKVGYVDTDERFNIWSPLAAMRVNENSSSRFLFHLLQSTSVQKQVKAKASHGSQPNLSMRALEQLKVPIPPLDVQRKIASVLDNFDALCNDLNIGLPAEIEARRKQYEYYRDRLLTFPVKEA